MNARTRRTSLAVLIALCLVSFGRGQERPVDPAKADFRVALNGKDGNPGTAAAPFATVRAARDAVRKKIAAGLTGDVLVVIHGGTYRISEPIVFGPEDSGTEKHAITYAAAPGEKVVISGGRPISGWKKGEGEIWTTEIPEVKAGKWYFRQLFINGQRAIRARTPNKGWCQGRPVKPIDPTKPDEPVVIRITVPGGVAAWKNHQDIELASIRNNDGGRKALESIDPAAQTVTLRPPHRWPSKVFGFDWYNPIPDGRCYLENAREFLDAPGEWYLDRATGVLSYWPRPGEDLAQAEVIAPVLQHTLLAVAGTRDRPVVNLHFRGLFVEHVDWPLPEQGYMGLFSCNVPTVREGGDHGHRFIDAAVEVAHARRCSFCEGGIARVGAMGLVLREDTADIAVAGNHIQQTGAGGIGLGYGDYYIKNAPPPDPGQYERFRVVNNYIHHCGADYHGGTGIAAYRMRHSTISHNLIHDTAYFGMCLAGDQDPKWNFVEGNTVQRNHIHRAMQITQDGAGLYLCFAHAGDKNLVRGNLVHDTSRNHASAGLYLDSACAGVKFDLNVIYRNPSMTVILNRKEDLAKNAWTDNLVFADREEAPPAEFIEAMRAYAGIETAYRKSLEGVEPRRCDLRELDAVSSDATWRAYQFDLRDQRRGVVLMVRRIDPRLASERAVTTVNRKAQYDESKQALWWPPAAGDVRVKPQGLDPAAQYAIKVYSGRVEPTLAPGQGGLLFPMVRQVAPTDELGLPETATGRELMESGLAVKPGTTPCTIWIAYQQKGLP